MSPSGVVRWLVSTPEGTVAHGEAEFVVVPTVAGELGVMADHAALVALVAVGELRVTSGGVVKSVPVGPGLVEVRDNTVRLLLSGAPPSQA